MNDKEAMKEKIQSFIQNSRKETLMTREEINALLERPDYREKTVLASCQSHLLSDFGWVSLDYSMCGVQIRLHARHDETYDVSSAMEYLYDCFPVRSPVVLVCVSAGSENTCVLLESDRDGTLIVDGPGRSSAVRGGGGDGDVFRIDGRGIAFRDGMGVGKAHPSCV